MSVVDKLYILAGFKNMWVEEYQFNNIDTIQIYHNSYNEMINAMMKKNDWSRKETIEVAKKECRKGHPPFTAEKQIALIKWLSSKYGIYIVDKYSVGFGTCVGKFCTQENFEDVLAESINHLWKDLTEEEKEEIRKILYCRKEWIS